MEEMVAHDIHGMMELISEETSFWDSTSCTEFQYILEEFEVIFLIFRTDN